MEPCTLCPFTCGVVRPLHEGGPGHYGVCRCAMTPKAARAALHHWEEPCLSGEDPQKGGSGAVFFSGCTLHCVYCQNSEISTENHGWEVTADRLRAIYQALIDQGAYNIDLVTATQYLPIILPSLTPALPVPVVYNTSGYERVETLRLLEGKVQIYLPDLKYHDDTLAQRYSRCNNYFTTASKAILEMFRQVGPYELDERGIMQKGVIIRHLILPGHGKDSMRLIDWIADTFSPGDVMVSLMRQYVPCGTAAQYPEINRKLTDDEYEEVELHFLESRIEDGFIQESPAADDKFIPAFDGMGILP